MEKVVDKCYWVLRTGEMFNLFEPLYGDKHGVGTHFKKPEDCPYCAKPVEVL